MKHRNNSHKDWVVGKDDVGHAILEWRVGSDETRKPDPDPCARTYDFLDTLDVGDLALEDDANQASLAKGLNPYDTGRIRVSRKFRD